MKQVIGFFDQAMRLKNLPRAGWERCGVRPCESVAEHSFGVSVLALVLSRAAGVDRGKCLALAVAHDLAEAIVGDITPRDGVAPVEKHRREREAIESMAQMLGHDELAALWEEYEQGQTPEAMLVRDLDSIEMAWQAMQYRRTRRRSGRAVRAIRTTAHADGAGQANHRDADRGVTSMVSSFRTL
jgi:putative hydrolase of HD superfamily